VSDIDGSPPEESPDLAQVIVLLTEEANLDEVVLGLEQAGLREARFFPITGLVVGAAPRAVLPDLQAVPGVLSVEPERSVSADDGDDQGPQ
jgi:hypothetical protein